MSERPALGATAMGLAAVVLWGSSVAFIRTVSEQVGPFSTAAFTYLFAGVVSLGVTAFAPGGLGRFRGLPPKYLWGCGGLFVTYTACFYLTVGLAADRSQVLEVGLINYLWPSLTLLLAVPIQGHRARWFLLPGMLVASAGMVIATAQQGSLSLAGLVANARANCVPYGLALAAAVTWALYSNLVRRWGGQGGGGVPLFLLASGLALLPLRFVFGESSLWTPRAVGEFLYLGLFTTVAAYVFWDHAMRKGDMVLVAAFSYFTPLFSTLVSVIWLDVIPGAAIWVACALIIAGALTCRFAVVEEGDRI